MSARPHLEPLPTRCPYCCGSRLVVQVEIAGAEDRKNAIQAPSYCQHLVCSVWFLWYELAESYGAQWSPPLLRLTPEEVLRLAPPPGDFDLRRAGVPWERIRATTTVYDRQSVSERGENGAVCRTDRPALVVYTLFATDPGRLVETHRRIHAADLAYLNATA